MTECHHYRTNYFSDGRNVFHTLATISTGVLQMEKCGMDQKKWHGFTEPLLLLCHFIVTNEALKDTNAAPKDL